MFDSEEARLVFFTRLLGVSVMLCLALCWKLWISRPVYPLVPLFGIVPAFPFPVDYLMLALFAGGLGSVVIRPRSKVCVAIVVALFALLFLQDQNRLWPSFYQFFFLFLLLASYRSDAGAYDAHRVLTGMRFIIAAVYFWGGVHKLNPYFFHKEFPWFLEPLTSLLPFEVPGLPAVAVFAALCEILIGIGLVTARFRSAALYSAVLMHMLIFFCIGPLRESWNNSSWMWGMTMAAQVWVLFFRAPAFGLKDMFDAPWVRNIPQALAMLFIGILPVLNGLNLWDSALSFNVYSGNVSYAEIHIRPEAADRLPAELQAFMTERPDRVVLRLNAWTLHEFNANPYPETRIFQAVLGRICSYLPEDAAILYVQEKASWFSPSTTHEYRCESQ